MKTFTREELTSMKRQALRHGDLELARMYQEDIDALENNEQEENLKLDEVQEIKDYYAQVYEDEEEEELELTTEYQSSDLLIQKDQHGMTYINGELIRDDKDIDMLMLEDLYLMNQTSKDLGTKLKARTSYGTMLMLLEEAKEYWDEEMTTIIFTHCNLKSRFSDLNVLNDSQA